MYRQAANDSWLDVCIRPCKIEYNLDPILFMCRHSTCRIYVGAAFNFLFDKSARHYASVRHGAPAINEVPVMEGRYHLLSKSRPARLGRALDALWHYMEKGGAKGYSKRNVENKGRESS